MKYNSLGNYYKILHFLASKYHYSIFDIENLYPFEREVIVTTIAVEIKREEDMRRYTGQIKL